MATTVWATRSATVGTPSTRTPPPCGLGISTARTGGGKYDPELMRFQILNRLFFRSSSNSSRVWRSTPGAPSLAATRLYASHTICLGMSNGLACDVGMFPLFLLGKPQLIDSTFLMSQPLGSAPTSREQGLHSYCGLVRQRTSPRYSVPTVSASARSLSGPGGCTSPMNGPRYRRSPSHVPCKSRRSGSRRLYAGHRLAKNTGARQAHPSGQTKPSVSMPSMPFDASTTTPGPPSDRALWSAFLIPT